MKLNANSSKNQINKKQIEKKGKLKGRKATNLEKNDKKRRQSISLSDLHTPKDIIDPSAKLEAERVTSHEAPPSSRKKHSTKGNDSYSSLSTSSPGSKTLRKKKKSPNFKHSHSSEKGKGKGFMKRLFKSKEKEIEASPSQDFFQNFTRLLTNNEFRDFIIDLDNRGDGEEKKAMLDVQSAWLDLILCMEPEIRDEVLGDIMYSAIAKANEPELILREDTNIKYILANYIQEHMENLSEIIQEELETYNTTEMYSKNPNDVDYDSLNQLLEETLELIEDFCFTLPPEVHHILYSTRSISAELFPENDLTGVFSLVFLQGINPLLTKMPVTHHKNRLITTILLQKLANQVVFDAENMSHYNPVLKKHQKKIDDIVDILKEKTSVEPSFDQEAVNPEKIRKDILLFMTFLSKNFSEFEKEYPESPAQYFYSTSAKAYKKAGMKRKGSDKTVAAWIEENQMTDPDEDYSKIMKLFDRSFENWSSEEIRIWLKASPQDPELASFLRTHDFSGRDFLNIAHENTPFDDKQIQNLIKIAVNKLNSEINHEPKKAFFRLSKKGIENWTTWDVAVWLNAIGMKDGIPTAFKNNLTGKTLNGMGLSEIYHLLNVKKVGEEITIKKSLEQMRND